jgi:hypothetical protein
MRNFNLNMPRARGQTFIVSDAEIMTVNEIIKEKCKIFELDFTEPLQAMKWLAKRLLIKNHHEC